jgi:hypothetical protein
MLIVGSYALGLYGISPREPNDIDIICTSKEYKSLLNRLNSLVSITELRYDGNKASVKFNAEGETTIIDASLYDVPGYLSESNAKLVRGHNWHVFHHPLLGLCEYIKPVAVLMLKYSHKYKKDSPFFLKTMNDIQVLQEQLGIESESELEPWLRDLLKERSKETYNYSLPKLNQSKSTFFTDSVPYKYDHDTIHLAVKHLDKPAYTYYQKDEAEVDCSKDKFFVAPEIVRLYGVLEESYVLALERSVIPFRTDPKKAFDKALEKVCTSITSGWFREYAYLNYYKVQEMYHESYVNKFNSALECGTIQSYKKGQE